LIDLYNRLKKKKITYESIIRLEKEVENAAGQHEDYRPWTVVRKGDLIGMINKTGKVMVPIAFALYQDSETMVFHETPDGEFAAARDPKTKLHGIIDRHGNWVIQPKYEELALNGDDNCFYAMTSKYDHGTWTGYDKTVIDLSR